MNDAIALGIVACVVGILAWPRAKARPAPAARQTLRFSEALFVGWFSEGMQWQQGDARCRIVAGIPQDAVLTGAYVDEESRELVVLMSSPSAPAGDIDVRFLMADSLRRRVKEAMAERN